MAQITRQFNEPFTQATTALPGNFSASVIGIAGRPYLLDTSGGDYRRQAVDVVQQRNTSDNRDLLLLPQDVWRQMVQSWHQGAGQSNVDRDDALPYRFTDSYGIDPWTKWRLSLLPATERLGSATYTGNVWISTFTGSASYLAVINSNKVYWFDQLSASASPISTQTVGTGDIIDTAHNYYSLLVMRSDKYIYEIAGPGATPSLLANHSYTDPTMLTSEKDFILVGDENKLFSAAKSVNPTQIVAHPDSTFRWYDAASGDAHIYVLGRASDRTTIYKVPITSTAALGSPSVAANLPDGEVGYAISSYLGMIFVGTDRGIRMATQSSTGDLTLGPIIPTNAPVRCFEGQDRFVWYGNSSMEAAYPLQGADSDLFPTGSVCGLGRMDLSTFTDNSAPAYADDIAATGETNKTVSSVVTYLNKRVFSINNGGIYWQSNNLVPAGWLTQGTVSFSVEDLKTGLYVQAKWLPLKGSIALDVAYDSTGYIRLVSIDTQDSIRSDNVTLNGTQFSRIDSRYLLRRDSTNFTAGPQFTRWEVRAIPVKGSASRWTLPIMNYDTVEIDGVIYNRDVLSELDTLMDLCESGQMFALQESGRAYQVHVKDFLWQPEKLSMNGKGWQGTFTMIVEEVA